MSDAAARATRPRPDARPTRVALGAGALMLVSLMAGGLVPSDASQVPGLPDPTDGDARSADRKRDRATVKRAVRYVRLQPGERPPRGATVIQAAAPTPRVVIVREPAPQVRRRVVVRTRQSGG